MKDELWRLMIVLIRRHEERKAEKRRDPNWRIIRLCLRVWIGCVIFAVIMSKIS